MLTTKADFAVTVSAAAGKSICLHDHFVVVTYLDANDNEIGAKYVHLDTLAVEYHVATPLDIDVADLIEIKKRRSW